MPLRERFLEYSTSFLMVCRLIDFALVVLKLLMFKVCVIIGILKIEFFNFSGTESVEQFRNWIWLCSLTSLRYTTFKIFWRKDLTLINQGGNNYHVIATIKTSWNCCGWISGNAHLKCSKLNSQSLTRHFC